MNKKKILCWSDSASTFTGFGVVSKYVLKALHNTGKYEISQLSINFPTRFVDTEDIRILPIMGELDGWEGITKLRIPASLLKQLIIQYLKQNEALKDPRVEKYLHVYKKSYYRYASQRQIYNQLGFFTWEEARNELVLPLIIEEIKFDESFSSIYNKYGWSKSTAHNHNRTSQRLFFRMDSSQVRQFLEDHYEIETYDDFKKEYLAEKG